jgi:O-antigen/teichoic acid export membrane protein
MAARMVSFATRFLTSPFTNRALGAGDRGILSVVGNVTGLFSVLLSPNVPASYYRTLPERRYSPQEYAGNSILLGAVSGAIILLAFFLSYPLFRDSIYRNTAYSYFLLSFLAVPLLLIRNYLQALFQGLGRMGEYNAIVRNEALIGFLFTVSLLLAGMFTVRTALLAGIGIALFSLANTVWYLGRHVPAPWRLSWPLLSTSLRDVSNVHIAGVATFITLKVDVLILNYYVSPALVGCYFVAVSIAEVLFLVPFGTQAVLYSRVSRETSEKAAAEVSVRAGRNTFYLTIAGALVFAASGKLLVLIVGGRDYRAAVAPLVTLLPGIVFQCLAMTLTPLCARKGMYRTMSLTAVSVAIGNLLLNVLFIPRWGITGAAVATTLSYALNAAVWIILLRAHLPAGPWAMFRLERSDMQYYRKLLDEFRGKS